jgi:polar amino acid transport system substrate-binding protein
LSVNVAAQDIDLVAQNSFQPFVYPNENGEPTGIAVTVVTALLEEAGVKTDPLTLYPLKRMIMMVLGKPNTLGFALFRTEARERQYTWIAPVTQTIRSVLIRLQSRSDIIINTLEDAKNYSIGVVDGNNLHAFLKKAGFENLDPVTTNARNYKKLFAGRIDLFVAREPSILTEMKALGYSDKDIVVEFEVRNEGPAWLLGNLQMPEDVIAKLQAAYERLKAKHLIESVTQYYYQAR